MPDSELSIAAFFSPASTDIAWTAEDLAFIWAHQIHRPLLADVSFLPVSAAAGIAQAVADPDLTFAGILHGPAPTPQNLIAVKQFAKSILTHQADLLPSDVPLGLYYLSIAAARVRLDVRISQLDDAAQGHAFQWLASQSWLDAASRDVIHTAIQLLAPVASPG